MQIFDRIFFGKGGGKFSRVKFMRSKNFISKYKFYFKVQMCQGRRSQIVHICKNPKTYPGASS